MSRAITGRSPSCNFPKRSRGREDGEFGDLRPLYSNVVIPSVARDRVEYWVRNRAPDGSFVGQPLRLLILRRQAERSPDNSRPAEHDTNRRIVRRFLLLHTRAVDSGDGVAADPVGGWDVSGCERWRDERASDRFYYRQRPDYRGDGFAVGGSPDDPSTCSG